MLRNFCRIAPLDRFGIGLNLCKASRENGLYLDGGRFYFATDSAAFFASAVVTKSTAS